MKLVAMGRYEIAVPFSDPAGHMLNETRSYLLHYDC
jgi:hypothetical protein